MNKYPLEQYFEKFISKDNTYETQVGNFIRFLKTPESNKIDNPNHIKKEDIDQFIGSSPQIKYIDTMASYLEGIKAFDAFLFSNGYTGSYIVPKDSDYGDFKKELAEKYNLKERVERDYLDSAVVQNILNSLDEYFMYITYDTLGKEAKERYIYWLCLRVYIKISLLAPAKKATLLSLTFSNFDTKFRTVTVNGVLIKIPNGLRYNILESLEFVKKISGMTYQTSDFFFEYYTVAVKGKKDIIGTTLNAKFCKYLKDNNLIEIENDKTSYSLEVLSNTTIHQMILNGTNPYYISQITGISIGQLASKYYNQIEDISIKISAESEINKSIASCDYYQYL